MSSEAYRYETIRQNVLDMIESGALKPGDKAPSLRRLAWRMRVSLSTVALAYSQLENEGVMEARPKSGFYVRKAREVLPPPSSRAQDTRPPEPLNRAGLIRKVMEDMARHDMIPLGVARTAESLLPLRQVNRILAQVLRNEGEKVGFYGPVQGLETLRRQIVLRIEQKLAHVQKAFDVVEVAAVEQQIVAFALARTGGQVGQLVIEVAADQVHARRHHVAGA